MKSYHEWLKTHRSSLISVYYEEQRYNSYDLFTYFRVEYDRYCDTFPSRHTITVSQQKVKAPAYACAILEDHFKG